MNRLSNLRERLGFSLDEVAAAAGVSRHDLREVEALADMDRLETTWVRTLGDLYGVDMERWLAAGDDDLAAVAPPLAALLRACSDTLDSDTRFAIAEASTVARQVRAMQTALGEERWRRSLSGFGHDADYSHPSAGAPERLARTAREQLSLGEGPIPSLRQLFDQLDVIVLWVSLPREIDAFSMANDELGGVVVANARGAHMASAFARRVSFAHELCHILFDRPRMREVERFCVTGRRDSRMDDLEARARAFTTYFLTPRESAMGCWNEIEGRPTEARVRALMERFGIGYEATRHHLHFLGLLDIDEEIAPVDTDTPPDWEAADPGAAASLHRKAQDTGVRMMRAGVLFDWVWQAYRAGAIGDSVARDELRLTAGAWQELKLAHAGLREGLWSTSSSVHREPT